MGATGIGVGGRKGDIARSWHAPVDKWLAFAELHCGGAFSSLPLPADVSVNISAKKPKMKAGAGAEELNVGVGWTGWRGIFSNRTSVVRNWLPSLKPKQCLTLTLHHIFSC